MQGSTLRPPGGLGGPPRGAAVRGPGPGGRSGGGSPAVDGPLGRGALVPGRRQSAAPAVGGAGGCRGALPLGTPGARQGGCRAVVDLRPGARRGGRRSPEEQAAGAPCLRLRPGVRQGGCRAVVGVRRVAALASAGGRRAPGGAAYRGPGTGPLGAGGHRSRPGARRAERSVAAPPGIGRTGAAASRRGPGLAGVRHPGRAAVRGVGRRGGCPAGSERKGPGGMARIRRCCGPVPDQWPSSRSRRTEAWLRSGVRDAVSRVTGPALVRRRRPSSAAAASGAASSASYR